MPLGILIKNKIIMEDMVAILEHYQKYCPSVDGTVKQMLCGGDGLTTKRGNEAKMARADAKTPEERLDGITMKSEDWHENVLCL